MDALTPAFVRWFEEGSPGSAAAALDCLTPVRAVMARYMERTPAADVTSLEARGLAVAVEDEILATVDAVGALAADTAVGATAREITGFVVDTIRAFIEFLVETGRWTGSPDQLAEVMDHFSAPATGEDGGGWGLVDVPDIPEQQALAVFSNLPLIQRVTALLQWIGEGKPVTATGALRQRDIEAAAACVGVVVRGGPKRADTPLPGAADDVPTVRSMFDVPLLARLWTTLESTELVQITSTKVVPTAEAVQFLAGGPSGRLEELVFIVDQYLETTVLGWDPAQPWERMLSGLQVSLLLAAATADPPEKARVLATPELAPAAEQAMAGLLTGVAMSRLEELAALGLLTIDTHLRVPPALVRCIANVFDDDWVLADLGLVDALDDDGYGPSAQIGATPLPAARKPGTHRSSEAATRPATGPILQLKILLNDSKPPIWRRVLVPAGMPLPQLHQVIQALYGWFDYHLHQFQTGGFRGPTYAPLDPGEDAVYGGPSRDEAAVTVGMLLPEVGSSMSYTYDFGDDWVLAIRAEKVLETDDGGQLPRCTAGRGAAPAEDSGGVGGWENIVKAVNDPRHEDHKEYREWLGMLPGDTIDPKAFDVDEANERLAGLF
ncbi:MAG TPA: plasmid pRiA4b ORF-3 family protein [Arthrobacter sp.]|nr:plasmid pRiA4b ORF-3 family protein [Arthrobacter sp.]